MQDPFKFIFVNAVASLLLVAGLFIYRRAAFPKRRFNFAVLLGLLSSLACLSLLRPGSFESGDFIVHTYRAIAFYQSLAEGHLLPSWAGALNATYGYPLFIFNYPLPYYLTSFFHMLGFSFISSMKLFLFACFFASGLLMYACAKQLLEDRLAAFTAAVFYLFAPYHLIDVHFRAGVGEVLVFVVLPLTWLAFQNLWKQRTAMSVLLSGLSIALAVYAHALIAPLIMIILAAYATVLTIQSKNSAHILLTGVSFVIGSICSLYILLTPFLLSRYTILASSPTPRPTLPAPWELLYSPWGGGFLFQGHHGELTYALGYPHILAAVLLVVWLVRGQVSRSYKRDILFWLTVCLSCPRVPHNLSRHGNLDQHAVPLQTRDELTALLGANRIRLVVAGRTAVCLVLRQRRRLLYLLLFVTVFSTMLNWGQRRVLPAVTDRTYLDTLWSSTSRMESHWFAMSKWRTWEHLAFTRRPAQRLSLREGAGR